MNIVFYLSAVVAVIATALVITRTNAMHALLYLIVSLLAMALIFFVLGAPFVAAMEVIVYAGAIMVLFIFAIMLLNLGPQSEKTERKWLRGSGWIGAAVLSLILLAELVYVILTHGQQALSGTVVPPQAVGATLYSTYLIGIELVSILLLASLVGAYHLGQLKKIKGEAQREHLIEVEMQQTQVGIIEKGPDQSEQSEAQKQI